MDSTAQPSLEQKRAIVEQEMARRSSGQLPSSAGIGAEVANNPSSGMPVDQMTNPPAMTGGASGGPSDMAAGALKQQKGEATKLAETLVWRMKKLTEGSAAQ